MLVIITKSYKLIIPNQLSFTHLLVLAHGKLLRFGQIAFVVQWVLELPALFNIEPVEELAIVDSIEGLDVYWNIADS